MTKSHVRTPRFYARRRAMQGLYQWSLSGGTKQEILEDLFQDESQSQKKLDGEYLSRLLEDILLSHTEIDSLYQPHLNERSIDELDPVAQAILRIGSYELQQRLEIPYRIVINEAIELAKQFGPTDSYKYVNGVLDRVATQCRSHEIDAEKTND